MKLFLIDWHNGHLFWSIFLSFGYLRLCIWELFGMTISWNDKCCQVSFCVLIIFHVLQHNRNHCAMEKIMEFYNLKWIGQTSTWLIILWALGVSQTVTRLIHTLIQILSMTLPRPWKGNGSLLWNFTWYGHVYKPDTNGKARVRSCVSSPFSRCTPILDWSE